MQNPAFIDFAWETDPTPLELGCSGLAHRALRASPDELQPPLDQNDTTSFAATSTQDGFAVHLDALPDSKPLEGLQHSGRTLQNLEKIMFSADAQGLPPGLLRLQARREGVHRDGPFGGSSLLYYNIGVPRSDVLAQTSCQCRLLGSVLANQTAKI